MNLETHSQLANFIWSICNLLRGPYKRNEYRKVILPLTVLRRFDCLLAPTKEQVLKEHAQVKVKPESVVRSLLEKITGRQFYNLSKLDLPKLLDDPNQLAPNLNSYINGFSKNVRKIMERFAFDQQIARMAEKNLLYEVIKAFSRIDLSLERVDSMQMGNVFEELIRIGEPVSVIAVDYDGNERRGLTARCRREDGSEYVVAASDVVLPQASAGARYIAAYRRWLNLDPYPAETPKPSRSRRQLKAAEDDIDLSKPVELVALAVKDRAARCRLLGSDRIITLRASRLWELVPGIIATVTPRKQWRYGGHPYLSGEIQSTRIDVKALDLVPLGLEEMGMWDPKEEYWGEADEPIEEWAKPIIAHGPRPMFEMERGLPGEDPDDPFNDPITRSNDLNDAGERAEAIKILMELCQADLRCQDAHSHLGNLVFDHRPQNAIRHYEVGLRIGELSMGDDFNGVLPWGLIDNRPFLRCMHGYGLCLWRLGRFDEAEHIFQQMLWLNPSDNQGVRFLIDDVKARTAWEDREVD